MSTALKCSEWYAQTWKYEQTLIFCVTFYHLKESSIFRGEGGGQGGQKQKFVRALMPDRCFP